MAQNVILKTLGRSLHFSGRAARAEFFIFLPAGLVLCSVGGAVAVWLDFTFPGVLLSVFCAGLPLWAVWWRGLQDVGDAGLHAGLPWVSLPFVLMFGWAATKAGTGRNVDTPEWRNPARLLLVVTGYLGKVFGDIVAQVIAMLIALPLFIAFPIRFSFALGQAFLFSQPGPNRYGPNPNEVPQ